MTEPKTAEVKVAERLAEIVSDEEIVSNHYGDFGGMTPRNVVNDGVRKAALGYHSGSTQIAILLGHGLITAPRGMNPDYNLTKKGKKYARALMHDALFAPASPPAETGEGCKYCAPGVITGLPGNACENCMGTGLSNPTEDEGSIESAAWAWVQNRYPDDSASDLAFDANEMVDAYIAGAARPSDQSDTERMRADAERYRFLRSRDPGPDGELPSAGPFIGQVPENLILTEDDADEAIDRARAALAEKAADKSAATGEA